MIAIRPCLETELPAAERLAADTFALLRQLYRPSHDALARKRTLEPRLTRLVALDGPELVGTVQYRIEDDRLHLLGLAVHPARQRQGIARALISHLLQLARDRGCRALSLYTIEQTGNVPIFERLGFSVISRTPARDLVSTFTSPLTDVFMERPL